MKTALVTATHHSAYTNGVKETSVGHGPTDADDAFLPVRANVTRGPADSYATPITVVVVTAKKMIFTRQSTRALTVSSRMSRGTSGAMVPQCQHSLDPFLLVLSAVP